MRSGAAAGHCGYFHETAFYGSDEELLAIVVPFVSEGREAGEPTLVTLNERNSALVRGILGAADGVEFVPSSTQYRNPAQTIADYRRRFTDLVAAGATQIRVVGDVPHPGHGVPWEAWARYEASVNHAYDDFPLWGMCPYDTRITPDFVLDEVRRTHPHEATPDGGHRHNHAFEAPGAFLRARDARPLDELQAGLPLVDTIDPTAAQARAAVVAAAGPLLDEDAAERLLLAVSETVTNGHLHGSAPVRLRVWATDGRAVATVEDRGSGPADPCTGLMPVHRDPGAPGGRGLWIAHQVCTDVSLRYDAGGGFGVHLLVDAAR